jgi:hypothetical protein
MTTFAALLYALGAIHLLVGVPAMLAPGIVWDRLPDRYADAVGDPEDWRQFGTALTIVGGAAVGLGGILG